MRKGALYFLLVLAVIAGVFLYFFRDRRIESFVEAMASDSNGGKVEIDNLHFSVLNLTFRLDRLQWTDPADRWHNLFETGPVEFSVEVTPLFWKKFIIREMKVAGVLTGTKRDTDGFWPKAPEEPGIFEEVMKSVEAEARAMPVFNLEALKKKANLDSLLNVDQLLAVQSARRLRTDIDSTGGYWENFLKTYDAKQKVADLESQARAISISDVKDLKGFVTTLQKVKDLRATATTLQDDVTTTKKRAEGDFGRLSSTIRNLDNLVKDDFEAAKKKVGLSDFDMKDIGKLLFGSPFQNRFQETMKYVAMGRKYLPTAQKLMAINKVEKPPRFKGQDISFPRRFAYPKFLIRDLHLSGAVGSVDSRTDLSDALQISGKASGITTEPPVYGKPTTFDLELFKQNSNAYAVRGVLDHTGEVAADTLRLSAANFALGRIDLRQNKSYLPAQLDGSRGRVDALLALRGDQVTASLELQVSKLNFIFADSAAPDDRIGEAIRGVFSSVNDFRFSASAAGPAKDLKFHLGSNLDEIFARRLRGIVQENLQRAQQEIRERIDKEVAARRQEVETQFAAKQALVMNEVNKYEKAVQDQVSALDAKKQEIEKKIEAEKKKGEDKLKKGLEKLLKQ